MALTNRKRTLPQPSSSESDRSDGKRQSVRMIEKNKKKQEKEENKGKGSGSSSSSENRRNGRLTKKKALPNREYCRGLPTELMKEVFSHCDHGELRNLCLVSKVFYLEAIPLLYQEFSPTDWTDLLILKRHLKNGIGPSSLDRQGVASSIARRIHTIKIPALKFHGKQREIEFLHKETLRCLTQVIKKAGSLRSFQLNVLTLPDDYTELWKTLQSYQLQELVMSEASMVYNLTVLELKSELWNLKNLSSIDLSLFTMPGLRRQHLLTGLAKVLQGSPNLKKLKLKLCNGTQSDVVEFDQLFGIRTFSHLEALDLENMQSKDGRKIRKFLASLENLKKLRFVHGHREGIPQHSPIDWKNLGGGIADSHHVLLPALSDVEVTGLSNLKEVLMINSAKFVHNVAVTCSGTTSNGPQIHAELSFLRDCTSVEELHLAIYGPTNLEISLPVTVSMLNCIPASVKRLAIRMPSTEDRVKMSHTTPRKNSLQALSRLVNLECLVLPWTTIVYFSSAQEAQVRGESRIESGAMEKIVETRAKQMAKLLAKNHPTLRYVIFEPSLDVNMTGDPCRPADFLLDGVKDGRSFVIEISRQLKEKPTRNIKKSASTKEVSPKPSSKTRKGRSSSQRRKPDGRIGAGSNNDDAKVSEFKGKGLDIDRANLVAEEAHIKVKMVSNTCICENCWIGGTYLRDSDHDLDSEDFEDFMMEYGHDSDDGFPYGMGMGGMLM